MATAANIKKSDTESANSDLLQRITSVDNVILAS